MRFLLLLGLGMGSAIPTYGQSAGDNFIQAGVLHAQTLDSSTPLRTTLQPSAANDLLGITSPFESAGTRVSVDNQTTIAITATHFFNERFAVKFEGGIPAIFKLYGSGIVAPTGPTGKLFNVDLGAPQNNQLATVRQWSPVLLLQYYFPLPQARIHPYFGLGATYTFFTGVRLSPGFEKSLNTNLGAVLALEEGQTAPTSARASASAAWAPVGNAGATFDITRRWSVVASVSYVLLHTNARVELHAGDGSLLSDSMTRIDLNTLATSLLVSFKI